MDFNLAVAYITRHLASDGDFDSSDAKAIKIASELMQARMKKIGQYQPRGNYAKKASKTSHKSEERSLRICQQVL